MIISCSSQCYTAAILRESNSTLLRKNYFLNWDGCFAVQFLCCTVIAVVCSDLFQCLILWLRNISKRIFVQIIKFLHGNQILEELQEEKYFNKCAACENKLGNNSILHVEFSTIYLLIKLVAVAATFLVTNHSSPSGS